MLLYEMHMQNGIGAKPIGGYGCQGIRSARKGECASRRNVRMTISCVGTEKSFEAEAIEAGANYRPGILASADFSTLSILLVDDNKFIRRLVAEILKSFGVRRISEAASAVEAVSLMGAQGNFDIVICDWSMEPKDGLFVLRALRGGKTRVNPATPFVMLTSECRRDKVMEALAEGVSSYIVKPISSKLLMHHLVKLILNDKARYEVD